MRKISLPVWFRWLMVFLPSLPLVWLVWQGATNTLDPDPGKTLVHGLGLWALRWLLLTLAMTPLTRLTAVQCVPLRRTLGLYALAYALLHLAGFAFFYVGLDLSLLLAELVKRPYVIAGSMGLIVLMGLGVTSTNGWQRRLGRRWKLLHRLIYPATVIVLVHFGWQVKAGLGAMPWYALVFVVLMLLRRVSRI